MLLTHLHYPKVPAIGEYDSSGIRHCKIYKSYSQVGKG